MQVKFATWLADKDDKLVWHAVQLNVAALDGLPSGLHELARGVRQSTALHWPALHSIVAHGPVEG
jgi:hypothetical protein